MWAHDLAPRYNRSASSDQSETLYFASAAKLVNGVFNVSFKMSDLNSKFRIIANAYAQSGVAFSTARIGT